MADALYRHPAACKVHREYVDGHLVRLLLEPYGADEDQTFDLTEDGPNEFVTIMLKEPMSEIRARGEADHG